MLKSSLIEDFLDFDSLRINTVYQLCMNIRMEDGTNAFTTKYCFIDDKHTFIDKKTNRKFIVVKAFMVFEDKKYEPEFYETSKLYIDNIFKLDNVDKDVFKKDMDKLYTNITCRHPERAKRLSVVLDYINQVI